MSQTRVKFWGVRGSLPAPGKKTAWAGGNTPCLEIRCGEELIICDAGSGIRELGYALMRRRAPLNATLLLSHLHLDHLIGLPFFIPLVIAQNRFVVMAPRTRGRKLAQDIVQLFSPPYFPLSLQHIPSTVSYKSVGRRPFHIGGIEVIPFPLHHPGGACGWRFQFPGGKVLVHVTDNEPQSMRQARAMVEWMTGGDVLIHDAQYTAQEYEYKHGWGHSPLLYPVELAAAAGIPQLYLFHHDPSHDDAHLKRMLHTAQSHIRKERLPLRCMLAREGVSFSL